MRFAPLRPIWPIVLPHLVSFGCQRGPFASYDVAVSAPGGRVATGQDQIADLTPASPADGTVVGVFGPVELAVPYTVRGGGPDADGPPDASETGDR